MPIQLCTTRRSIGPYPLALLLALVIGCLSVPARADDAANSAVHQSYFAMQSVHSYRIKTVTHRSTPGATDLTSLSELTQSPRRMQPFFTIGPEKAEQIIDGTTLYLRVGHGPWKRDATPGQAAPSWGSVWAKRDDPRAVYRLARHEVINAAPMTVYVADQAQPFRRTETEVWIGTRDHLPHRIIRRMSGSGNTKTVVTEVLSDFNAPMTISLPL